MPKLSTAVPKYRRKRSGRNVYAVVTMDGIEHPLGRYNSASSRKLYDRLVAEYLANDRQLPTDKHSELTVADLCVRFFKHVQKYYVKNGQQSNEVAMFRRAIKPVRRLYEDSLAIEFPKFHRHSHRIMTTHSPHGTIQSKLVP